ncbi:hypothetical protein OA857_01490 [Alphaproteobacteria bacterium]|nr:hypothetical protein [Alphaproteobacteria bacterium]
MYKTKLLTLSLISLIFLSCTKSTSNQNNSKFSIGYIDGEFDGLVLKTLIKNNLFNIGRYDKESKLIIDAEISHTSSLFITNIDNTSDRMNMDSNLSIKIIDQLNECEVYKFDNEISQFYIFADSNQYISNVVAEKKIKEQNTEQLVKEFINKISRSEIVCKE